jgi:opacity protein-like surface antigen
MPRYVKLVITVILAMVISTSGYAQLGRLGFFINAAGFSPQQKNMKIGFGSGLGVAIHLNPAISISIEWKYSRFDVDEEEGKFLDGTLTVTPIMASVHYNLALNESFSPYVFAGGGLFFSNFRLSEQLNLQEMNIRKQNTKNGLGFYGGIGTAIKLKKSLYLFFEGLYLRRTTDVETTYLDSSALTTFRVDLSSFSILIGLNYRY